MSRQAFVAKAARILFLCLFFKAVTCCCGWIYLQLLPQAQKFHSISCGCAIKSFFVVVNHDVRTTAESPEIKDKIRVLSSVVVGEAEGSSQQSGAELMGCDGGLTAFNNLELDLHHSCQPFPVRTVWHSDRILLIVWKGWQSSSAARNVFIISSFIKKEAEKIRLYATEHDCDGAAAHPTGSAVLLILCHRSQMRKTWRHFFHWTKRVQLFQLSCRNCELHSHNNWNLLGAEKVFVVQKRASPPEDAPDALNHRFHR